MSKYLVLIVFLVCGCMDKNRNRMKECPVSNVLFCDKTEAEWDTLCKEVKVKKGGFDL